MIPLLLGEQFPVVIYKNKCVRLYIQFSLQNNQ